jgi:hypothetical protein
MLPRLALSVRQPWAYAIIHLGKDIENRAWRNPNPGLAFRGRVAIHASTGMTRAEYEEARDFIDEFGHCPPCPGPTALFRGGIIGSVEVVDVVGASGSRWFFGPRGLVLREPRACQFIPAKGALGFFKWTPGSADAVPKPAQWMLPKAPKLAATFARMQPEPGLFDDGGKP